MKSVLTTLSIIVLAMFANAQKHTISGRVNAYSPAGKIYVILCSKESFQKKMAGIDTLEFWVNYDRKYIEYKFTNVPEGEYALRSFQDVNGNHKLDKWMLGYLEPWAFSYSGEMKFPPTFNDISFLLMTDLRINLTLGK